ncbi:MAG: sodium-translocating pyrophosphatase [Candidatus Ancillula sp.]|jgi:K(+)-stimulated pyrophosphate-energized sodium pump|nr:sodium-translocating pyrophosphatase [Candidatus Ancillula sp.]
MDLTSLIWLAPVAGVLSIVAAGIIAKDVLKKDAGDDKMKEIAAAVQEGAMAYLNKQYSVIAIVGVVLAILIGIFIGWQTTLCFIVGAIFSGVAGYTGMNVSVRANVRTAAAAKKSLKDALNVAFRGGAVTGLAVVGLSLLGVSGMYLIFGGNVQFVVGFGFGASLISLFARVGGGIFTKAADVGADIVGKVESNLNEDDPRNPATIADNVGDNVGDCAGMGADLFETYAVTLLAAMMIGVTIGGGRFVALPLVLGSVAILASIAAIFCVRLGSNNKIMQALYKGVGAASIISLVLFFFVILFGMGDLKYFWVSLVGIAITVLMVIFTEYYTSTKYRPVKEIAKASETGAGTNVISGLSFGFESTILPVIIIIAGILISYSIGGGFATPSQGLYAIAIAAVAMLSTTGMIVALDSYGPITDNAGGIAEMSEQPKEVRVITDELDAIGNTTKAVTKGYAIGSAALGALALFAEFHDKVINTVPPVAVKTITSAAGKDAYNHANALAQFSIDNPLVLVGLLIGAVLPFAFTSVTMRAVSKAASAVIEEVRRQIRELGILEGKNKPEYGKCVSIVTGAALKEMIVPGLMAVVVPVLVGLFFGSLALAGTLIGIIVVGLMLAMTLNNAGGAWDNAKKLIEEGNYGGKGSEAHKAAVVGDTVGDPTKDTSGPGLNALIKVVNMVSILTITLYSTGGIFFH